MLDNTVSDIVGAVPPVRKAIGFSVFGPPFTTRVGVALTISRLTVTPVPVKPVATMGTVVELKPGPKVVQPALTENVRTLSVVP